MIFLMLIVCLLLRLRRIGGQNRFLVLTFHRRGLAVRIRWPPQHQNSTVLVMPEVCQYRQGTDSATALSDFNWVCAIAMCGGEKVRALRSFQV
jgi:hypothetical protein